MNYPVWELYTAGGGFLIAFIAVIHVYVAHFAVGGGLYLVLMEKKAYKLQSDVLLSYVQGHSKFFLLLTMVFGGLTGVGIWFTIALLNPGATSTLIHTFVFGWAMEWVCFVGEIVALFIYYYKFGKMTPSIHLRIGWLYFIFAWLSLVLINGIVAFMLTPGAWLESGGFWAGFFNPSMLPGAVFRTAIAILYAGIFGYLTATFINDSALRKSVTRYCAKWVIIGVVAAAIGALFYYKQLPEAVQTMLLKRSPELFIYLKVFLICSVVLIPAGIFMALRAPQKVQKAVAFVILALGLVYMGGFEFMREGGRRPFVIYDHTYANSIPVTETAAANGQGFLTSARWIKHRQIDPDNRTAAGKEIFRIQCQGCHSIGGIMNDILPRTEKFSVFGMDSNAQRFGQNQRLHAAVYGNQGRTDSPGPVHCLSTARPHGRPGTHTGAPSAIGSACL